MPPIRMLLRTKLLPSTAVSSEVVVVMRMSTPIRGDLPTERGHGVGTFVADIEERQFANFQESIATARIRESAKACEHRPHQ